MTGMILGRIEAPHFVAGLDIEHRRVTAAAPIIAYMIGWPTRKVLEYCRRKNWTFIRVHPIRPAIGIRQARRAEARKIF